MAQVSERLTSQQALLRDVEARAAAAHSPGAARQPVLGGQARWVEVHADEVADAVVQAMAINGIDYLFFSSGSDIGFYQEATVKARVLETSRRSAMQLAARVLRAHDPLEVRAALERFAQRVR